MKSHSYSQRGKRNRQRGAELQRQVVKAAKTYGLDSWNRDRGGAQHEQGDVEINGLYFGCKRKKTCAHWLYPEKEEWGVFFREDSRELMAVIPAVFLFDLMVDFIKADKKR